MNKLPKHKGVIALIISIFFISCGAQDVHYVTDEALTITKKVADWQIKTFADMGKYRALPTANRKRWHHRKRYKDVVWNCGALYSGLIEFNRISKDSTYTNWLLDIGYRNGWRLDDHKTVFNADNHTVGLAYIELYKERKDDKILEPLLKAFDTIIATSEENRLYWTWADALFMSPPVWASLYNLTGEIKYLEYMDKQYKMAYERLWNPKDQLFYRDNGKKKLREKNGANEYWARGNGWVYGGLTYMLPNLPKDWEGTPFYIQLFKEMSEALKRTQRTDGTWSMGIMGLESDYPTKEISGANFFVFGLARGVNMGILDKATYDPVIRKGWKALTACVRDDGLVGYVQGVGAAPGEAFPNYTEVYGTGGFLAAGSEMYKYLKNSTKN
ncbi:glycoside hydrolase family 88 protein [Flavivirga amylovorans]|uniref:Glycoside hydrolase family 88 protein n=1 Tax=Flavivirga amylovorans TaxID=870486 RepID=A0ABT8WX01_9FLAO|nr:glycoside hydrolase family 88 protein [Flavivirga amylovorans]MDO5986216.1 glycoside hydrolase family 88 protein [Flavivirga amylovorans]